MFLFWTIKATRSIFGLDVNDPSHYVQVFMCAFMSGHVCVDLEFHL